MPIKHVHALIYSDTKPQTGNDIKGNTNNHNTPHLYKSCISCCISTGTTQEPTGVVSCPECPTISDCPTQQSPLTSPDITPESVTG